MPDDALDEVLEMDSLESPELAEEPDAVFAAFFFGFFFFVIGAEHSKFGAPRHEKELQKRGKCPVNAKAFGKAKVP